MLIFAHEFDGVCRTMRKAFVRSELLIRQIYPEDTDTMPFAFSCMYWHSASAYREA